MNPLRFFSSPINEVSSEDFTSPFRATAGETTSFAMLSPLLDSVDNRDGVCDLEATVDEQRLDEGDEFRFSIGMSSEVGNVIMRGLDLGVPDVELVLVGVFIGTLADLELLLLRRRLAELSLFGTFMLVCVASIESLHTYGSTEVLLTICDLLTLPDGMLSLLSADATPGILLLVLKSGRCSRGVLAVRDSRNMDV